MVSRVAGVVRRESQTPTGAGSPRAAGVAGTPASAVPSTAAHAGGVTSPRPRPASMPNPRRPACRHGSSSARRQAYRHRNRPVHVLRLKPQAFDRAKRLLSPASHAQRSALGGTATKSNTATSQNALPVQEVKRQRYRQPRPYAVRLFARDTSLQRGNSFVASCQSQQPDFLREHASQPPCAPAGAFAGAHAAVARRVCQQQRAEIGRGKVQRSSRVQRRP